MGAGTSKESKSKGPGEGLRSGKKCDKGILQSGKSSTPGETAAFWAPSTPMCDREVPARQRGARLR